jgi:hypothetical protein
MDVPRLVWVLIVGIVALLLFDFLFMCVRLTPTLGEGESGRPSM